MFNVPELGHKPTENCRLALAASNAKPTNVCRFDFTAPSSQRRYCDRRKTVLLQRSPLRTALVPCGNFHHSVQDFRWWARLLAACLRISWAELPPDGTLRVTAHRLDEVAISRVERKFIARLGRRGVSYAWFREWTAPGVGRHLHLAVRILDGNFDLAGVGRLWGESLAGTRGSSYGASIDNLIGGTVPDWRRWQAHRSAAAGGSDHLLRTAGFSCEAACTAQAGSQSGMACPPACPGDAHG